ncbi:hypothetical protein LCGC14_1520100 [marine sediment metagenome]|uniref:Transposase IS116/IS110/IS902 family protein n=1 Tax=marine sediment metagenome TaxID=412755 RepID=A0A0F9LZY9_9ZZZZ
MSKVALKEEAARRQNGKSAMGADLPRDSDGKLIDPLIDLHRPTPREEGGKYTPDNTQVVTPVEHQDHHGNTPWLNDPELVRLRAIMSDYRTSMKLRIKVNNHKLAVERGMDELTPEVEVMFDEVLADISEPEKHFRKLAEKQLKLVNLPIIPVMRAIRGIGPIFTAETVTLVNMEKAPYPSSINSFAGFHKASHERYVKGVKGGGHKGYRTAQFLQATSFLRSSNEEYGALYYARKADRSASDLIVSTMFTWMEDGVKKHERRDMPWKDVNPSHRHGDALRYMMKRFNCHMWHVWRELMGLSTVSPWIQEHGGHQHIDDPRDFGWDW